LSWKALRLYAIAFRNRAATRSEVVDWAIWMSSGLHGRAANIGFTWQRLSLLECRARA
jgi:hypothetical protein